MKIDRILMPTDFSDCAAAALSHAVALAQQFDAELHFLHAVVLYVEDPHRPGHDFPELDEIRGRLEEVASGEMQRLVDERPTGELRIHKAQRRAFSPAPAILDYAAEKAVDLIVLGTHGRRGLRRFLLGSVAEEVVRSATCPVLTVRDEGEAGFDRFDRIVVPSDFSADSRRALKVAAELAAIYGGRIDLVHVVAPPVDPRLEAPGYDRVLFESVTSDKVPAEVNKALDGLVGELGDVGVPIEVHALDGYPASSVARHAEATGADLIVIASHGLSGFYRFLLGSVAERVIRSAACPVLTLRPPAGEAGAQAATGSPGRGAA